VVTPVLTPVDSLEYQPLLVKLSAFVIARDQPDIPLACRE